MSLTPSPRESVCHFPSWAPLGPPLYSLNANGNPLKPVCSMIPPTGPGHTMACPAALAAESPSPPSAVHSSSCPHLKLFRSFSFKEIVEPESSRCQLTLVYNILPTPKHTGWGCGRIGGFLAGLLNCPRPKSYEGPSDILLPRLEFQSVGFSGHSGLQLQSSRPSLSYFPSVPVPQTPSQGCQGF